MNNTIQRSIELTQQMIEDAKVSGKKVSCSVSGGADSDILIDLCERTVPHFVSYVFFDTGIEYQATKEHLDWLEQKYDIEIHREKAKVPVPLSNKKYGKPRKELYAHCWIDRNPQNEEIIQAIADSVSIEASISCSVRHKYCSVCGNDKLKEHCKCDYGYEILDGVTDIYDWFFEPLVVKEKTFKCQK